MQRLNRRSLLAGVLATGFVLGPGLVAAEPVALTPVPVQAPSGTPAPGLPISTEDIGILWTAPWELEGKLVQFNAIVRQRFIASDGQGYAVGDDGLHYRSLILARIPNGAYGPAGNAVFVATNESLDSINGKRTVNVIGSYGGEMSFLDPDVGGVWTVPIVIAASIS